MHDSERNRISVSGRQTTKGSLQSVHAYTFKHADRQDLFQEIAIQVWRSVDAFRGDSSVPTWLYRVALVNMLLGDRFDSHRPPRLADLAETVSDPFTSRDH